MGRRGWGRGKARWGRSQASPRAWDKAFLLLPPLEDVHQEGTEWRVVFCALPSAQEAPAPTAPELRPQPQVLAVPSPEPSS